MCKCWPSFHFPCPRHPQLRTTTRTDPFCLASAAPALQLNVISTQTKTFDLFIRDVFVSRSVTAWQTVLVVFDVMAVDGTMKIVMGLVDCGRKASVCVRLGETCLSRALTAVEASCFTVVRRTHLEEAGSTVVAVTRSFHQCTSHVKSLCFPAVDVRARKLWVHTKKVCPNVVCACEESMLLDETRRLGLWTLLTQHCNIFRQDKLTDPMHLRSEFLPRTSLVVLISSGCQFGVYFQVYCLSP